MPKSLEQSIFKKGSTTYYFSSKFFPANKRQDVSKLYSFVRVADDFVDVIPQDVDGFNAFRALWAKSMQKGGVYGPETKQARVVQNMIELVQSYNFESKWVESFLDAMQADLSHKPCTTYKQTEKYMYGSAEVIGLMMSKIMGLPNKALPYAQKQGAAMQLINFVRDVDEDNALGRQYLPVNEMKKYNLKSLLKKDALANTKAFKQFIDIQLDRYHKLQSEAEQGYKYIPKRYLVPIKTAADMYSWTAEQITADPFVVYEKKVKPRKRRIIATATKNTASS